MPIFSTISVHAISSPPETESSPPDRELDTDSLSSITTSRSNGVNWPTVRLPETRTSNSSTQYTITPRTMNSHHGKLISNTSLSSA